MKIQANVDSFEDDESDEPKSKAGSDSIDSEEDSPSIDPVSGNPQATPTAAATKGQQTEKENVQPANLSQDMGLCPLSLHLKLNKLDDGFLILFLRIR